MLSCRWWLSRHFTAALVTPLIKHCFLFFFLPFQERVIEALREQKDREDRVRLEELEQMRKENQVLKETLSALQPHKLPQSQPANSVLTQNQRPDGAVSMHCFDNLGKDVL